MNSFACLIVIVFSIAAIVFILVGQSRARTDAEQRRQAAHDAYKAALANLKISPSNPHLKEEALRLGRSYANLTRDQKGVTIFDEVALSNDISAATAGAAVAQSAPAPTDIASQLERLADLRAKGILTDDEFQAQKRKLLG